MRRSFAEVRPVSLLAGGLLVLAPASSMPALMHGPAVSDAVPSAITCSPVASEYYQIELVPTRNVAGTAFVKGRADVSFRSSPFTVSIGPDGSYAQDVHVHLEGLKGAPNGHAWTAWVTTSEIDEIERLGALDETGRVSGPVSWNKFLVVVTLEPMSDEPGVAHTPSVESGEARAMRFAWQGPIAFRGMSRSGRMHTMVGHGPLQDENCAAYGFSR